MTGAELPELPELSDDPLHAAEMVAAYTETALDFADKGDLALVQACLRRIAQWALLLPRPEE